MKTKDQKLKNTFWKGNKILFVITLAAVLVLNSMNFVVSIVLQEVIDIAAGIGGLPELKMVGIKVIITLIVLAVIGFVHAKTCSTFLSRAMKNYKDRVTEKIMKKGIGAFRKESSSLYVSGLTNDCQVIETGYLTNRFDIVVQIFLFIGSFVIMIGYSPLLTLVTVGFGILPVVASILTGNRIAPLEEKTSTKNSDFVSIITEVLTGFSVVKSFKAELKVFKLVAKQNHELEDTRRKREFVKSTLSMIGSLAGVTTQLGVFIVGALLCIQGKGITPGMLGVFINLINFIVGPIGKLPTYFANMKASKKLIEKMENALDKEIDEKTDDEPCTLDRGISVENLTFGYDKDKNVLNNVNYFFEKNKSYAVVGASGCGKSTLLQLLLSGMNDYSGSIKYDDKELSKIGAESLYDVVSTIQQNVFVFNASIKDNITMFGDFPEEEIERVIKLSGLEDFVKEKGSDYMCGENGSGLSGGEKQRISIARALLRKSKVLLVDEATAALDAETSNHVLNSILDIKDLTRIVVTHDLDEGSLKKFDRIITLKNGSVLESGTFNELMDEKGYFYSLYTVAQ